MSEGEKYAAARRLVLRVGVKTLIWILRIFCAICGLIIFILIIIFMLSSNKISEIEVENIENEHVSLVYKLDYPKEKRARKAAFKAYLRGAEGRDVFLGAARTDLYKYAYWVGPDHLNVCPLVDALETRPAVSIVGDDGQRRVVRITTNCAPLPGKPPVKAEAAKVPAKP